MKLLFVVNEANFFLSHRLPLALEAQRRGVEVCVVCGENTGEERLEHHDIDYRTFALSRSGVNPVAEIRSYRQLLRLYREIEPDLVHHVTIKPVLYGTVAARVTGIKGVVNAIPGMGFVFTRRGYFARARRGFVNSMYRLALAHRNMRVIFQNREDLRAFLSDSIVARDQAVLIRGAGVDLTHYEATPEPKTDTVFVLVARMLRDKGVGEFVAAAERLHQKYPDWGFWLVGDVDPGNPASLSIERLQEWDEAGIVQWLGHRDDVSELLKASHVVCLPSYYREGLPKSLLEGAAASRAIIASRVAGCLEVVTDGVTGVIVEPRDIEDLTAAMARLGNDPALRQRLGRAARAKAEAIFSVDDVVNDTFMVYQQLLECAG